MVIHGINKLRNSFCRSSGLDHSELMSHFGTQALSCICFATFENTDCRPSAIPALGLARAGQQISVRSMVKEKQLDHKELDELTLDWAAVWVGCERSAHHCGQAGDWLSVSVSVFRVY